MKTSIQSLVILWSLFLSLTITAQPAHKFQLNYESNSFTLTFRQKERIDSVCKLLSKNVQGYKVEIIGHSDNVGNQAANEEISLNRADAAMDYFLDKGFLMDKINISGKGFLNPLEDNSTELGKLANRRITITIQPEMVVLGRKKIAGDKGIAGLRIKAERNRMDAESGAVITYSSGTKITIPPSAFVTKDGKPVKGKVDILYCEYRDPMDFVVSGIPMSHTEKGKPYQFNSAGMFKVLAFSNGLPVYLKIDKPLEVKFAVVSKLPNLNFYNLDTISEKWTELAKLTGPDGKGLSTSGYDAAQEFQKSLLSTSSCTLGQCTTLRAGVYLALHPAMIYQKLTETETTFKQDKRKLLADIQQLKEALHKNKGDLNRVDEEIKKQTHTYKAKAVRENPRRTVLHLNCYSKTNNEFEGLEKVYWKYKTEEQGALKASVVTKYWTNCEIVKAGENYNVVLSDEKEQIVLDHLQLKIKGVMGKKNRAARMESLLFDYSTVRKLYKDRLEEVVNSKAPFLKENEDLLHMLDSLEQLKSVNDWIYSLFHMGTDSATCFWKESKVFMTASESRMSFREWCNYFDAHRSEMSERYTTARDRNSECPATAELAVCIVPPLTENSKLSAQADRDVSYITETMNINSLGIYNFDALKTLSNTVEVSATYKDNKGNTIIPEYIYIMDDSFNGLIRYEASGAYTPSKFIFTKDASITLIAFDKNRVAYICNAKTISGLQVNAKKIKATFVLEKTGRLKTKAEFKKLL